MATTKIEGSARERLLAAASELFYGEGVHSIGIDRVIERAGVAKASLYNTFGSKDELVRAYLERRAATRKERITAVIAREPDPRRAILAVFDLLDEIVRERSFRGCAFVNACADGASEDTRAISKQMRAWVRGTFTQLAERAGAKDASALGRRLGLLYSGALVSAAMDDDPGAVADARAMAELLLEREVPAKRAKKAASAGKTRARG
jgi:AcrR family transcriptional regulator